MPALYRRLRCTMPAPVTVLWNRCYILTLAAGRSFYFRVGLFAAVALEFGIQSMVYHWENQSVQAQAQFAFAFDAPGACIGDFAAEIRANRDDDLVVDVMGRSAEVDESPVWRGSEMPFSKMTPIRVRTDESVAPVPAGGSGLGGVVGAAVGLRPSEPARNCAAELKPKRKVSSEPETSVQLSPFPPMLCLRMRCYVRRCL